MFSRFFLFIIILFEYTLPYYTFALVSIGAGNSPNVTGLVPNISSSTTTSLYAANINLTLTVYERPVNGTFKETIRILKGSTNMNSTDRCIVFGISFKAWIQTSIRENGTIEYGGCDAILGKNCSQSIRDLLHQSLQDINSTTCGITGGNIIFQTPQICLQNKLSFYYIISSVLFENGTFIWINGTLPTDPSVTWAYEISDSSINSDLNQPTRYFTFTYFAGRSYSTDTIETALACFPTLNKATVQPFSYGYFLILVLCVVLHLNIK